MNVKLIPRVTADGADAPPILEIRPDAGAAARTMIVPVHREPLREPGEPGAFNVEVCGFRIEAASPEGLVDPSRRLLRGLTVGGYLPTYVFIARRTRRMYPVYTVGDEVMATTPGGPVFRHVELARVRARLTDYLRAVGDLGIPGRSDRLHVRGVSESTLSLVRPVFYLKKRAAEPGDHDFWSPVFPGSDGHSIYTYAASGRREVDLADGHEVLLLRRQVAQALMADGRLARDEDLRIDRLHLDLAGRIQRQLEMEDLVLTAGDRVFPVFRNRRHMIAFEPREGEARCGLHLGRSHGDLLEGMARILVRRGGLEHVRLMTWAKAG